MWDLHFVLSQTGFPERKEMHSQICCHPLCVVLQKNYQIETCLEGQNPRPFRTFLGMYAPGIRNNSIRLHSLGRGMGMRGEGYERGTSDRDGD